MVVAKRELVNGEEYDVHQAHTRASPSTTTSPSPRQSTPRTPTSPGAGQQPARQLLPHALFPQNVINQAEALQRVYANQSLLQRVQALIYRRYPQIAQENGEMLYDLAPQSFWQDLGLILDVIIDVHASPGPDATQVVETTSAPQDGQHQYTNTSDASFLPPGADTQVLILNPDNIDAWIESLLAPLPPTQENSSPLTTSSFNEDKPPSSAPSPPSRAPSPSTLWSSSSPQKPPCHSASSHSSLSSCSDDSDGNCCVCWERSPQVVLVPCGHTLCKICSDLLSECPKCRGAIADRIVFNTRPWQLVSTSRSNPCQQRY
jgi:hypothetical protein